MKNKKRIVSVLLTLVLVFAMAIPVAAAGGGSITISNAVKDQTYSAYKILELESYNAATNAYSYKAATKWSGFIEGNDYVNVDGKGYVTWKDGASVELFAKAAKEYAVENKIGPEKTAVAKSETVNFTGLDLGYYLVDTSLGTICSLDTTNPTANIEEKNKVPSIVKQVKEEANDAWGSWNDAEIGQDVEFKAVITAFPGAANYVMHDKMDKGLTLKPDTIAVEGLTKGTDYTVVTEHSCSTFEGECDFEVRFTPRYLNSITAQRDLVVTYKATVNEYAVIGTPGNPNTATLSYGNTVTPNSITRTYTWDMEVLKYGNGEEKNVLAGAKFKLLNKDGQAAVIANGKISGWAVEADGTELVTDANGKIYIAGLDSDNYALKETAAPEGYNKLTDTVAVKPVPTVKDGAVEKYITVVAKINNNSGTELPSTGGMGTTMFYLMGAIMVIGAGVVLVTRRRVA